jgi:hypothetical protein
MYVQRCFYTPRVNHDFTKLISGKLQLSDGTILILDDRPFSMNDPAAAAKPAKSTKEGTKHSTLFDRAENMGLARVKIRRNCSSAGLRLRRVKHTTLVIYWLNSRCIDGQYHCGLQ